MQPPAATALRLLRRVAGVLTDIDDTLTRDGAIEAPAATAARPARRRRCRHRHHRPPGGWSEPFAATWPVVAIVAEAARWRCAAPAAICCRISSQDDGRRAATPNACAVRRLPGRDGRAGARLASPASAGPTDIAVDHSEFRHLPPKRIAQVVDLMPGRRTSRHGGSIHINGWIGAHSKWTGAQWMLRRLFGRRAMRRSTVGLRGRQRQRPADVRALPARRGRRQPTAISPPQHWPAWITQADAEEGALPGARRGRRPPPGQTKG